MMVHSMSRDMMNRESPDKGLDSGKYVRYTPEQVEALERVYTECPKPSSLRRQQLIRECPILSNIEPKQIKVWFQNRRWNFIFFPYQSCYLLSVLIVFLPLDYLFVCIWVYEDVKCFSFFDWSVVFKFPCCSYLTRIFWISVIILLWVLIVF